MSCLFWTLVLVYYLGKYVPYTVSELVHDDRIVFEPTYYTYDYTYENPLILSMLMGMVGSSFAIIPLAFNP